MAESPLRLVDAPMLPVCTLAHADTHKVVKDLAQFGKNHQGWHYGFKLHASVDPERRDKQKRFFLAQWQFRLLALRPKIESAFDCLKEHLQLVASFPRSL